MLIICTRTLLYNKLKTTWRHQITISRFQTFTTRKCEAQITKYWTIPLFTSYIIDFQYKKNRVIYTLSFSKMSLLISCSSWSIALMWNDCETLLFPITILLFTVKLNIKICFHGNMIYEYDICKLAGHLREWPQASGLKPITSWYRSTHTNFFRWVHSFTTGNFEKKCQMVVLVSVVNLVYTRVVPFSFSKTSQNRGMNCKDLQTLRPLTEVSLFSVTVKLYF